MLEKQKDQDQHQLQAEVLCYQQFVVQTKMLFEVLKVRLQLSKSQFQQKPSLVEAAVAELQTLPCWLWLLVEISRKLVVAELYFNIVSFFSFCTILHYNSYLFNS